MEALCRTAEAELPELNDDTVIYRDLYFLWERQTFHDALVKFLVLENSLYRRPHFIDEGIQSHCYVKHANEVDLDLENYDVENNAHFENRINKYMWGDDTLLTVPYPFD
uniref:DUF2263 domain-containing protein n=1 Tax=Panagrellus redivivus TaxID=6233 RepID=A0A7E4UMB6_PANRE